jgi:hypothetical protein
MGVPTGIEIFSRFFLMAGADAPSLNIPAMPARRNVGGGDPCEVPLAVEA